MNKRKKCIIIALFSIVILFTILTFIGINYQKKENKEIKIEEKIPKITEEYISANMIKLKSYNDNIYFEDNNAFYFKNGNKYIIFKNNKLLEEEIEQITDNNFLDKLNFKKYEYFIKDDNRCLKTKSNNKTICYEELYKISNQLNSTDYLVIKNNEQLYLLNPNNDTIVDLKNIDAYKILGNTESGDIIVKEYDYLPICTNYNKCGLTDYYANKVIDYIYDYLEYINKDIIICNKNGKMGIINYKNEIKINIEYDFIQVINDYIITTKNNKLAVFNKNYKPILENIDIIINSNEFDDMGFLYYTNENDLYIKVNKKLYYLSNNKIQKSIDIKGETVLLYNENNKLRYLYTYYEDENKLNIIFYDTDLYEYYKIQKEIIKNIDYTIEVNKAFKNKEYYSIYISYDVPDYNQAYYIDLLNSKELKEIDALYKYFDNGYGFTLSNKSLKLYKQKELLNEFVGNYIYLGNYIFLYKNEIFKLEFEKESREIS